VRARLGHAPVHGQRAEERHDDQDQCCKWRQQPCSQRGDAWLISQRGEVVHARQAHDLPPGPLMGVLPLAVGGVGLLWLTMQEPILCLSLPRSTGDRAYQRWRFHNQSILVCVIAILRAVLRTRLAALASVLVTRQWADQLGNAIEGKTRTRPLWAGHVREGEGDMGSRRVLGLGRDFPPYAPIYAGQPDSDSSGFHRGGCKVCGVVNLAEIGICGRTP
jgi:hypothetical protein